MTIQPRPSTQAKFWTREDHAVVAQYRRVRLMQEQFIGNKPEVPNV